MPPRTTELCQIQSLFQSLSHSHTSNSRLSIKLLLWTRSMRDRKKINAFSGNLRNTKSIPLLLNVIHHNPNRRCSIKLPLWTRSMGIEKDKYLRREQQRNKSEGKQTEVDDGQMVQKLFNSPFMIRVQMVFRGVQKSGQSVPLHIPNAI